LEYSEAVARLYELGHELAKYTSADFDLGQMRLLLDALCDPQQRFRSVLIAGTNGKGSTAATLASILHSAGHRTGLYTSPHLNRPNERIQIDGCEIPDEAFARIFERVDAAAVRLVNEGTLRAHPSFFEMMTAMAFCWFASTPASAKTALPPQTAQIRRGFGDPGLAGDPGAESNVEIAVLEVGMGGRLDATNTVEPLLSVITDISLDHQKYLGNTVAEIAREKAGIMRPGGTVITLPQHPRANEVIGNRAMELGAQLITPTQYVRASAATEPRDVYEVEVMGEAIQVESPLVGRHQHRNLALAIGAAEMLNELGIYIAPRHIEAGIRQTRWPGRYQVLRRGPGTPDIVLDVAHNPAGAWALRAAISEHYFSPARHSWTAGGAGVAAEGAATANRPDRPVTLVFGVLRDKAIAEMVSILFPIARRVVLTQANNPRSASVEEIRAAAQRSLVAGAEIFAKPAVAPALEKALKFAEPDGVVVITGSIYVVGEALAALRPEQAQKRAVEG
jgi:dihydrofolate synthase / folylpolyglutamate synthase